MNLLECAIQQLSSKAPAVPAKPQPLPSHVLVLSVRGLGKGQISQRVTFYTHQDGSLQTSSLLTPHPPLTKYWAGGSPGNLSPTIILEGWILPALLFTGLSDTQLVTLSPWPNNFESLFWF